MPVGRPDFWYGQVLLFESSPTDGRTDAGPTSDWAYDHKANAAAHHAAFISADAAALIATHTAIAAAHHAAFVAADAAALIATHTAIAAAHHAAFVAADAAALIATHTAIAAAHHAAFVAADAAALIATHTAIAAAHHAKTVSGDIDHGSVAGLADDDHTQYARTDMSRVLTGAPAVNTDSAIVTKQESGTTQFTLFSNIAANIGFGIWSAALSGWLFYFDPTGNLGLPGTVDGVDIAAHAANASAHHVKYTDAEAAAAAKPYFTDRGDPAAADKTQATLTCNSTWRDWDLSATVPAGATAVLIRVCMHRDDAGGSILLRKNGNSYSINIGGMTHGEAGALQYGEIIVACDSNRVIEYYGVGATWTILNLTVGGWWK